MAGNNAISGKDAVVHLDDCTVLRVRNWTMTKDPNVKVWGDSSKSAKQRISGKPDTTGTFRTQMDTTLSAPVEEGEYYDAEFHIDGTDGNYIALEIMIGTIDVEGDPDDGTESQYVVNWGGNGDLPVEYGVFSRTGGSSSGVSC